MKKTVFFLLTVALFAATSCKKKDSTPSKTDMITAGSYRVTAVVSDNDNNGSYETDDFITFPDCFKDNIYTFRSNGNVEFDEGASKCDPNDPQTETHTWQLSQNDTHIILDSDEYILEELNTSTLKIKETFASGSSVVTFTKR